MTLENFFVDRETHRQDFKNNLESIKNDLPASKFVTYYAGTGGVGKSALMQELEKYLISKIDDDFKNFKYVSYDFTHGAEMLTVLISLKKNLSDDFGIKFPFFEEGVINYYQKRGDFAGLLQLGSDSKGNSLLNSTINNLYDISNIGRVGRSIFDETVGFMDALSGSVIPGFNLVKTGYKIGKNVYKGVQKGQLETEIFYKNFVAELRKRESEFNPEAVKEYLPTIFAKDISYWLKKENLYLTVFLDTYENLTGDEKESPRHEKLIYANRDVPADWWVEDLLNNTDRVFWIIAGRGEISKIGENFEIKKYEQLFSLTALEDNFAEDFLIKAGVTDDNLRGELIKLTGGYPNYLAVCVDTYQEIVASRRTPTLEDFGNNSQAVINRLLDFTSDATQNIVKRLCILGTWTDVYAERILMILHENNRKTYERVKKLSFVAAQSENIFAIDKIIQEFLSAHLKNAERTFVIETRKAADKFLHSIFYDADSEENKNITDAERNLYFKFCCEIILRTTDDAEYLLKEYVENVAPLTPLFEIAVIEGIAERFKNKIEKITDAENLPYAYFEHLLTQIKFSQGNDEDALKLSKNAYEKIVTESNFSNLKYSMSNGHYSMALFYAMRTADKDSDEFKNLSANFKFVLKRMPAADKKIVLNHFGNILSCLLNVYRKNEEVIQLIDNTMNFIGECSDKFILDLKLYKMAAESHLGKVNQFSKIDELETMPDIKSGGNFEQHIIYFNRRIVALQDSFAYEESLNLGCKVIKWIEDLLSRENKTSEEYFKNQLFYKDQLFRVCGSLASSCYFTLNNSTKYLELARNFSNVAINGFIFMSDKMRQYQIRAQIEAEAGNFDFACQMLNNGINITIENPQAEQFKNFPAFSWYHFAKFAERLLKSSDKKYFEIAKRAIEIARQEFLNYRDELNNLPQKYPDYITFSKMGICFNILGDKEFAMQLHKAALRGVDVAIGDNISVKPTVAAFRVIMLDNALPACEKKESLKEKLTNCLEEYLSQVNVESMKIPFADINKISRAILL